MELDKLEWGALPERETLVYLIGYLQRALELGAVIDVSTWNEALATAREETGA